MSSLKISGSIFLLLLFFILTGTCFAGAQSDASIPAIGEKAPANLPRLVDLGADRCIPCKMMAPILEELRKEYVGKLEVEFIDVWKNPDKAAAYGVRMIPTQIFYDGAGKELARHSGFIGKEDILNQWRKLGYEFKH